MTDYEVYDKFFADEEYDLENAPPELYSYRSGWNNGLKRAAILISDEVRPKGEWVKWNFKTFGAMGDWEYKCSNCEKVYGGEYNFCPNCGSGMRKGGTK